MRIEPMIKKDTRSGNLRSNEVARKSTRWETQTAHYYTNSTHLTVAICDCIYSNRPGYLVLAFLKPINSLQSLILDLVYCLCRLFPSIRITITRLSASSYVYEDDRFSHSLSICIINRFVLLHVLLNNIRSHHSTSPSTHLIKTHTTPSSSSIYIHVYRRITTIPTYSPTSHQFSPLL